MSGSRPPRTVALVSGLSFPPFTMPEAHRVVALARHLPALGWRPVVLTVPATYLPSRFCDASLLGQVPDGVEVHRTRPSLEREFGSLHPLLERAAASTVDRLVRAIRTRLLVPDVAANWAPAGFRTLRRLAARGRIDAVLTTSSPSSVHLVGWAAARRLGIPWLADFQTPWSQGLERPGRLRRRLRAELGRAVLADASHVTAVSGGIAATLAGLERVPPSRITVVPNGLPSLPGPAPASRRGERLRIVHTGRLVPGRDLRPFFEAVDRLTARDASVASRLEVVLAGHVHERVAASVRRFSDRPWLTVLPWRSREETLELQRRADVLLHVPGAFTLAADGVRHTISMPGKGTEYLGAGRPILVLSSVDGDAERIVRETGAGAVVPQRDTAAIERVLEGMLAGDGLPPPPDPDRLAPYLWERLVGRIAPLLDRIAGSPAAGGAVTPAGRAASRQPS